MGTEREGVGTGREGLRTGREGVGIGREGVGTGRKGVGTGREGFGTEREVRVGIGREGTEEMGTWEDSGDWEGRGWELEEKTVDQLEQTGFCTVVGGENGLFAVVF